MKYIENLDIISSMLKEFTSTTPHVFIPYNDWERKSDDGTKMVSDENAINVIYTLVSDLEWFKATIPTLRIILKDNITTIHWTARVCVAIAYFDAARFQYDYLERNMESEPTT